MATNEETNFVTGNEQTKEEKKVANQNGNGWQSVTIGGVTGILMGAGAMYAAESFATKPNTEEVEQEQVDTTTTSTEPLNSNKEDVTENHVTPNELKVAEVDQNLSFGQAFAAARGAVGPGGVFHWHGGIYNTYRVEEWNAMSANEKDQFAQQVKPEIRAGEGHASHYHHDVAQNDVKLDELVESEKPVSQEADGDVHFLGFTNVNLHGHVFAAGHSSVRVGDEERHMYYIDLDHDPNNEFDIALFDANDDGKFSLSEGEVFNIRESHMNVEEFSLMSSMDEANRQSAQETNQVLLTTQESTVNDTNDADPTI